MGEAPAKPVYRISPAGQERMRAAIAAVPCRGQGEQRCLLPLRVCALSWSTLSARGHLLWSFGT